MSSVPKRIVNVDTLPSYDLHPQCPVNGQMIINGSIPTSPNTIPNYEDPLQMDVDGGTAFYHTQSYDAMLFDIRRIQPERIATQLTLIDLPLFKAIRMEEFTNCNWTKKEKVCLAPNIVAFIRKFNHTTFWVVREILNEENPRIRAEIITQFIKIAKELFYLNNLHSLKAVVAGLQNFPIDRLAQTWKSVPRKERATFEKLGDFLSVENNRKTLRDHMNVAKLPCIPHLGMYLTDLTYLHELSTRGQGHSAQVDTVMNMIAYCQNSTYDGLIPEEPIRKYLMHTRYIDELQKFFEDDNYKLSLRREPDPVVVRQRKDVKSLGHTAKLQLQTSKSHKDLLTPFSSNSGDSLTTVGSHSDPKVWTPQASHRELVTRHSSPQIERRGTVASYLGPSYPSLSESQIQVTVEGSPSTSRSKKTSTLPTSRGSSFLSSGSGGSRPVSRASSEKRRKSLSDNDPSEARKLPEFLPLHPEPLFRKPHLSPTLRLKKQRGHLKSQSLGTNVLSVLGIAARHSPTRSLETSPEFTPVHPRNLIDDNVMEDTFTSFSTNTPTGSVGNLSSSGSSLVSVEDEVEEGEQLYKKLDDVDELSLIEEGLLKRKVLRRNGKSLSLRRQTKCWVQLTSTSLLLYASRPKTKKSSKSQQKAKGMLLKSCRVKYPVDKSDKQFIVNDDNGNHVKFTGKSAPVAQEWVEKIRSVISEEEERERREVERSLIKL